MTSADRVFLELRDAIVSGRLAAGSRHSIYRLAEELDVSRTPAREAVLRLADLGLVVVEKNRGVVVVGVSPQDVLDVFELRVLLEVPAAARAAREATPELAERLRVGLDAMRAAADVGDEQAFTEHDRALHGFVAAASGNVRLEEEIRRLRGSIQARGVSTIDTSRSIHAVAEEHAPLVDAIARGDASAAARAMLEHLLHTAELLARQVGGGAEPDAGWPDRVRVLVGVE
ncbi:hypothetical protein ASD11_11570 [Aeromicrobium sp. Root495]|uniref:GntR family transcriptional regulator n=1 Tax=Aeromicrobium sp. Root495 TaxID=1736550 RepID=UPI0006FA2401|nr:GntR family transcriptional regulator [Aeromicrobium sp. Root495]KQY60124.1 hypothetical protein ASD11_11570 [Aeromicrobium sp. Root495]